MRTTSTKRGLLVLILLLSVTIWGKPVSAQEPARILVMPVSAKSADLEKHIADFTLQIREYFRNNSRIVMLGDDQLQALLGASTGTNQQLLQVAGEKLDCQSAILLTLERYRERLGDEYSTTDPASLAFSFRLLNIADGKAICFGQFDETQQSVSENVLTIGQAFKRGFKWITIADLTREALKHKFADCPGLADSAP
ncbi:MAG: hypothetical protein HGA96_12340 [Desulfobulbaceae bacterium]|nr:hypothetical protein [Desulfobulbaceae bacterium]